MLGRWEFPSLVQPGVLEYSHSLGHSVRGHGLRRPPPHTGVNFAQGPTSASYAFLARASEKREHVFVMAGVMSNRVSLESREGATPTGVTQVGSRGELRP